METSATPPPITGQIKKTPGSQWPKILGIIALVFGILGILQAAISPLSAMMTKGTMQPFVQQGASQADVDAYLAKLQAFSFIGAGVYAVLGIILLVGGIFLLKRKSSAPLILQIWAVLKVVSGGVLLYRTYGISSMQMEIIMAGDSSGSAAAIAKGAAIGGAVGGFIWILILPVFLIIWFNRRVIKEQVRNW